MTGPRLQAVLGIGAIGAALALVGLLGTAGDVVGVGLMTLATILTASSAPQGNTGRSSASPAGRPRTSAPVSWWNLLAGGTALAMIGVAVGLVAEGPGGLITAVGGGLVIVGVVFGMP
jgi:hypothetical protein